MGGQPNVLCQLNDPAAADDNITLVEDRGLPGRECALRLVEGHENLVRASLFDDCGRGLMAVADLGRDGFEKHRIVEGAGACDRVGRRCRSGACGSALAGETLNLVTES